MQLQRFFEDLGAAACFSGIRIRDGGEVGNRRTDRIHRGLNAGGFRTLKVCQFAQRPNFRFLLAGATAPHEGGYAVEIPWLAVQRFQTLPGPFILKRHQTLPDLIDFVADGFVNLCPRRSRLAKIVGRGKQIFEPKDAGKRIGEFCRSFLQHGAEFVVGKERTKGRQRLRPSQRIQRCGFPVMQETGFAAVEAFAGAPCSGDQIGFSPTVNEELRRCARIRSDGDSATLLSRLLCVSRPTFDYRR